MCYKVIDVDYEWGIVDTEGAYMSINYEGSGGTDVYEGGYGS